MIRTTSTRLALVAGIVAIATSGCGRIVEKAAEQAVEKAVENDTGEDVDIDFSDGEIRVESADGDVTIRADENGVDIDGVDADGNDFSVDADESGVQIQGQDGSSLDIDDDGTFVATDENGEVVTGAADDDGYTVEGPDGEAVFTTSEGIPDQWPGDVPEPDGLRDVTGTYFSDGDDLSIIVSGTASGGLNDTFDDYTAALEDAGFDEESTFTQGDEAATSTFLRGDRRVTVSIQSVGDTVEMVVALS